MKNYDENEFIEILGKRMGREYKNCPFCGRGKYITPDTFAGVFVSKDIKNVDLGLRIPSGMVICENCGHIDFFALGSLDLINDKEKEE